MLLYAAATDQTGDPSAFLDPRRLGPLGLAALLGGVALGLRVTRIMLGPRPPGPA